MAQCGGGKWINGTEQHNGAAAAAKEAVATTPKFIPHSRN